MADLQKVFDQLYNCLVSQDVTKPRPRSAEPTRETVEKLPPESQMNARGNPSPPWLSAYQTVGNRIQTQCCGRLSPDYNQNTPKCRVSPDQIQNTAQNTCSLGHRQNTLLQRGSPDGRQSTAQNTCSPEHRQNILHISGILDHKQNTARGTYSYNFKQNTAQVKGSPDHRQNTESSKCKLDHKQNTAAIKVSPDHRQNTERIKCWLDHKHNTAQIKGSPDHKQNTERIKCWLDHKQNTTQINGQLDHRRKIAKCGKNHKQNTVKITCGPDHGQNTARNMHSPEEVQNTAKITGCLNHGQNTVKIPCSPDQRQEAVMMICSPDQRQKTARNYGSPDHKHKVWITHGLNQVQGTTNPEPRQNTANMTCSTKDRQNTGRITRSQSHKQYTVMSSMNTETEPVKSAAVCTTVTLQDCKQGPRDTGCGDSDTASDKSGYTANSGTGSNISQNKLICSSKSVRKKKNANTSSDSAVTTERTTKSKGEVKSAEEHNKSDSAKLNDITKVNRSGEPEFEENVKTGVPNKANLQLSRSSFVANAKCKNKSMPTTVNWSFCATAEKTEAGKICNITTGKTTGAEESSNVILDSGPCQVKLDKTKKSNTSFDVTGIKAMGTDQVIPEMSGKNAGANKNCDQFPDNTAEAPLVANTPSKSTKSHSSPKVKNLSANMNMTCNVIKKPAHANRTFDIIGNKVTETNRSCDVLPNKTRKTNKSCDVIGNKTAGTNRSCDVNVKKTTDANRSSDVIMNITTETNKSVIKNASCEKSKDRKVKANTLSSTLSTSLNSDEEKLAAPEVTGASKIPTASCMDNNISKRSTLQKAELPSSPCRKRTRLCLSKSRQTTGVVMCSAPLSEGEVDTHPQDKAMTDQSKQHGHSMMERKKKMGGDAQEQQDEESDAASDESGYHMGPKKIGGKGTPKKNASSSNRVHVNSKKRKRTMGSDVTSAQPTCASLKGEKLGGHLSHKAEDPMTTSSSQKEAAPNLIKQKEEMNTVKQVQTQNDHKNAGHISLDNVQKSTRKTSHKVDQSRKRKSPDVTRESGEDAEEHQDEEADAASDVSGYCVKSKNKADRKQNLKGLESSKQHRLQRIKGKEQSGRRTSRDVDNGIPWQEKCKGLPSKVKEATNRDRYSSIKSRKISRSDSKKQNLKNNKSTRNYKKCSDSKSKITKKTSASVKLSFHNAHKKKRRRNSGSVCSDNSTHKTCKKKRLGSEVSGHISPSQSQKKESSKKNTKCDLKNKSNKSHNSAKRDPKRGSQSKKGSVKTDCMKDKTGGTTDTRSSPIVNVIDKKAEVEQWVRESVQQTLAYSNQDYAVDALVNGDPIGLFSLNHPGGIWKNVASDS